MCGIRLKWWHVNLLMPLHGVIHVIGYDDGMETVIRLHGEGGFTSAALAIFTVGVIHK